MNKISTMYITPKICLLLEEENKKKKSFGISSKHFLAFAAQKLIS